MGWLSDTLGDVFGGIGDVIGIGADILGGIGGGGNNNNSNNNSSGGGGSVFNDIGNILGGAGTIYGLLELSRNAQVDPAVRAQAAQLAQYAEQEAKVRVDELKRRQEIASVLQGETYAEPTSPYYPTYQRELMAAQDAVGRRRAAIPMAIQNIMAANERALRRGRPYGVFGNDARRDETMTRMAMQARDQIARETPDPRLTAHNATRDYLGKIIGLNTGASTQPAQSSLGTTINIANQEQAAKNVLPSTVLNLSLGRLGLQNPQQVAYKAT